MAAHVVSTSITCPAAGCEQGSEARSSFDWGHAEIRYCGACRARTGMVSIQVRATDLVHYLPEQEAPSFMRHSAGLVWFAA